MENNLLEFLNTLPDIDEFMYVDDGNHVITSEWLVGTFAGRGFYGDTHEECADKLKSYLDAHIGHDSVVGVVVSDSGWPNLERVKSYIIHRFYEEGE